MLPDGTEANAEPATVGAGAMPQADRFRERLGGRTGAPRCAMVDDIKEFSGRRGGGGRGGGGSGAGGRGGRPPAKASTKPATPEATTEVPVDEASAIGPAKRIEMTIIAQDPRFRDADGKIVRAKVNVPADRFRRPFQTHRFNVISFDPVAGGPGPEFNLLVGDPPDERYRDRFKDASDDEILTTDDFHAQNVFAIASRTLQAFEAALGRRVPWDFDTHQLYLVPHAEIRANAGYAQNKRAVLFGLVPHPDGPTRYSCLSHDVVAHEVTHALLDGLRSAFFVPALPDQLAFHEGFADIVGLLSVFAVPTVLQTALGKAFGDKPMALDQVSTEALKESVLFQIAEEFGEEIHGRTGQPLRDSIHLPTGDWWRTRIGYDEPHNRGEIIVAAIARAVVDMWFNRLTQLMEGGPAPQPLVAEEGAKSAEHLLRMCLRAIDYCPPLEFEFEDFLEAIVFADRLVAPDDEHGYVRSIIEGFDAFAIGFPPHRDVDVDALRRRPDYSRFNYTALQFDRDEVFRYIWENDELLGISMQYATEVESVRPSVRVGPDGFVARETVVSYIQYVDGTAGELAELSKRERGPLTDKRERLELPPGLEADTPVRMYGGGTIVFDQFGRPKYQQHKPLLDWPRQSKRLKHLVEHPDVSAASRLGAPLAFRIEPLAAAHRADPEASERW